MSLYNSLEMDLSNREKIRLLQEKMVNGEDMSSGVILFGRDHPVKKMGNFICKNDHVYRAVSDRMCDVYLDTGFIMGTSEEDEYLEYEENGQVYNNNKGVDWFLGGFDKKYGKIVIECPADMDYFFPAFDNGCDLVVDPSIRHFKSSGYKNPVPIWMIKRIIDVRLLVDDAKEQLGEDKYMELVNQQRKRELFLEDVKLNQNNKIKR